MKKRHYVGIIGCNRLLVTTFRNVGVKNGHKISLFLAEFSYWCNWEEEMVRDGIPQSAAIYSAYQEHLRIFWASRRKSGLFYSLKLSKAVLAKRIKPV